MTVTRRTHRVLGLVLLLPICGWALTGFVFFVKPGSEAAYAGLQIRSYPLGAVSGPTAKLDWVEMRLIRTILGDHLLVRTESGSLHLDPETLRPRELPDDPAIRQLVGDAIAADQARYGQIVAVARHPGDPPSASVETSTGVKIELDWNTLSLRQSGRDTRRIDALYRVHYLQWTGIRVLDRVLGVAGLVSLVFLAILGARLAFAEGHEPADA